MRNFIFIVLIFFLVLSISWVVYDQVKKYHLLQDNSSESDQTVQKENIGEMQTMSTDLPPLPTRYWSEFTQQLMQVEGERTTVTDTLSKKFPPIDPQFFESLDSTVQGTVMSPQQKTEPIETVTAVTSYPPKVDKPIRWTNVSQQIRQLEQQRQQVIDVLMRRGSVDHHH